MKVDVIRTISPFERVCLTCTLSFSVKMNIQSVSESLFLTEQIQKRVTALKS